MEAQVALGIPIYIVGVHAMATLLLRHLDAFSHDVSDSEKENWTRFIQNQLFKLHVLLTVSVKEYNVRGIVIILNAS